MRSLKLKISYERKRSLVGYVFILPWILGFLIFFAKPFIQSFIFTFQDVKMTAKGFSATYIGLQNYIFALLKDPILVQYISRSLVDVAYGVVIITVYSLFIAVVLNQSFKGRTFYRAVFFLPVIITAGVVLVMLKDEVFSTTFNTTQNVYLFKSTGVRDILIQAGVNYKIVGIFTDVINRIFALSWKSGIQILLFLGGLQTIPPTSYEASKMEGASGWATFWKITIPTISPIIILNIVYTIIDTFTEYGTEYSGNVVMSLIYRTGFIDFLYAYSATQAWIYFAVIAAVLGIAYFLVGKRVFYMVD